MRLIVRCKGPNPLSGGGRRPAGERASRGGVPAGGGGSSGLAGVPADEPSGRARSRNDPENEKGSPRAGSPRYAGTFPAIPYSNQPFTSMMRWAVPDPCWATAEIRPSASTPTIVLFARVLSGT